MPKKTLYVRDADLPIWEAAEKMIGEKSMSTLVTEALREKLNAQGGYDYAIKMLNGGEVGITALTDRARQRSRLQIGHMIAFKSRFEATQYVTVAESEGFTFDSKEYLGNRVVARARIVHVSDGLKSDPFWLREEDKARFVWYGAPLTDGEPLAAANSEIAAWKVLEAWVSKHPGITIDRL